jgi:hypothetical protein
MNSIQKNVMALMILCNAIETKLYLLLHNMSPRFGGGHTGRKWNEMMEAGWDLDLTLDGTNKLTKTIPWTQMERIVVLPYCCGFCEEDNGDLKTDYVSSASRRLARIRAAMVFNLQCRRGTVTAWEREDGYYCDAIATKRTLRSIAYLAKKHTIHHGNGYKSVKRNWTLIQEEGVVEQQEIFEAQMKRLGDCAEDVRDYRSECVVEFDNDRSYASHIRGNRTTKARYLGHHGYDW